MKISELIDKLKKYPADARVIAPGYEDGFDDVLDLEEIDIRPQVNSEWFRGVHAEVEPGSAGRVENAVLLVLSRRSG